MTKPVRASRGSRCRVEEAAVGTPQGGKGPKDLYVAPVEADLFTCFSERSIRGIEISSLGGPAWKNEPSGILPEIRRSQGE